MEARYQHQILIHWAPFWGWALFGFVLVRKVCEAIVDILLPRYIKVPSGDRLRDVVDDFDCKWGFPQCVGAIDGTHIPIMSPTENGLDYFNRKGHHSVVMQALVTCDYIFIDISVGWPGSVHDTHVLPIPSCSKRQKLVPFSPTPPSP